MAAGGSGDATATKSTVDSFTTDPKTLTRFLLQQEAKFPEATGDFTLLMSSVQLACKVVESAVRKAGLAGLHGLHGAVNVQGEEVKKLDVIANENFVNALKFSNKCAVIVSEEEERAIVLPAGRYCLAMDPLDGSSNIDCGISVGTIFGIFRRPGDGTSPGKEEDALLPGSSLVAAGYCMFGSSTQLCLAFSGGGGVSLFTLDPSIGEFLLTHKSVRIPEKPKQIVSVNFGNMASFSPGIRKYVTECLEGRGEGEEKTKPYSARYVGSMIADVHRTLLYGGIFLYPATGSNPDGKLRLLYEANPMALIMEAAGGMASTGKGRILDVAPSHIHQRIPVILGCTRDVERCLQCIREEEGEGEGEAAAAGGAE